MTWTLTATFPPIPIRWLGSSPKLPPFGISGFQKSLSLHRSQILRDLQAMQAVAAEFPGCAEKFYCFQERRVLNTLFRFIYFPNLLLNT
jgi:hypothetical protein